MALASGAAFAGYVIARRLGSGSTGEVYLVQDHQSACWRAVKILSPALSTDAEFRRRFRAETPAAARLRHPHIVEVHERGEFYGQLYVAMDYIDGINAARLIAGRFPAVSPAAEVLAVVTAVAEALDHAHQSGLLHRDVRPENILLTGRGEEEHRILLADFGIARSPETASGTDIPAGYAPPELLTGAAIDGRADQYALAATAYHLLTGAPPAAHPPRLSAQRPELARLDGVFARALAELPGDRFRTCGEFARAANDQAGVAGKDRTPEAVLVAEHPSYPRPGPRHTDDSRPAGRATPTVRRPAARTPAGRARHSTAARPAAREPAVAQPGSLRPRTIALASAAVVLVIGLVGLAFFLGRTSAPRTVRASPAAQTVAPAPAAAAAPPVPLEGTYRLEVQRSKQTYNYVADPQPPDVTTWWAFRSSCGPAVCVAAALQLDDTDHRQVASSGGHQLIMRFADGRWQSQPDDAQIACVGPSGSTRTQATTVVLSLRPQPDGDFTGEETVTVQSNDCGQRSAVMRIPAVLARSGDVPAAVTGLDPSTATATATATPAAPHR
ncbi:MAG: serine/threonine protein kinase, bacterial [Mycobacterium sp.]|jgi:serine/threonine-protein kinase|nr:serine/threonine protein kinase, bacterial [Mycobacterium sp.]